MGNTLYWSQKSHYPWLHCHEIDLGIILFRRPCFIWWNQNMHHFRITKVTKIERSAFFFFFFWGGGGGTPGIGLLQDLSVCINRCSALKNHCLLYYHHYRNGQWCHNLWKYGVPMHLLAGISRNLSELSDYRIQRILDVFSVVFQVETPVLTMPFFWYKSLPSMNLNKNR